MCARLPVSAAQLSSEWTTLCEVLYTELEQRIDELAVGGLREDLKTSIPTLPEFKESVAGRHDGKLPSTLIVRAA